MPGACISPGKMIQFHLRGDCIGFPDVVPDLLRYANTGADFLLLPAISTAVTIQDSYSFGLCSGCLSSTVLRLFRSQSP